MAPSGFSLAGMKVSIAGFRGIIGETMTPELAMHLAAVFADYCTRGTIILARDSRPSGTVLREAVLAGLRSRGQNVIDLGIVPTPTVGFTVLQRGAAGAINLTASHNPAQWNALKLYGPDGSFITAEMLDEILALHEEGTPPCLSHDQFGSLEEDPDAGLLHVDKVLAEIDVEAIRKRGFRVAVDGCRGAGSMLQPTLLRRLGCSVVELDCIPDGAFTRVCEPLAENLGELCRTVVHESCDMGMALDPDADRLALVDRTGRAIGEEYSLALATDAVFSQGGRTAVANLSTSRMIDDVAAKWGGRVVRTAIGEANVVGAIRSQGAEIGGEGNGGVIWPTVHAGRDALSGAGLILDHLARTGMTFEAWVGQIPSYVMAKHTAKVPTDRVEELLDETHRLHAHAELNEEDGTKVIYPDRWVHVRASMTEPIVRVIAEAPTQADVDALCEPLLASAARLSKG